jgi:alpha-D-ribose 1-methylphosphonate 5-triphosphate synthase subunit PhnI
MPRTGISKIKAPLNQGDKLGVSFGVTIRMGDYQSLRVEAWAESTKREGETTSEAYKRVFDLCEKEVNQKAGEYKNDG